MLLASAVVVWEWLNEHGRWRPYSPAVSHHIEAVARAGPRAGGSVVLGQADSRLAPYIIDLQSMHQFRQDTGESHRGVPTPVPAGPCAGLRVAYALLRVAGCLRPGPPAPPDSPPWPRVAQRRGARHRTALAARWGVAPHRAVPFRTARPRTAPRAPLRRVPAPRCAPGSRPAALPSPCTTVHGVAAPGPRCLARVRCFPA